MEALSGMRLALAGESPAAPCLTGQFGIGLWQYTDGKQPAAEVTFDNLELRTYELPLVGVERAVRLSWPAPVGVNYSVESAPTLQGPWLPVEGVAFPGIQTLTVPLNNPVEFFRLREAP